MAPSFPYSGSARVSHGKDFPFDPGASSSSLAPDREWTLVSRGRSRIKHASRSRSRIPQHPAPRHHVPPSKVPPKPAALPRASGPIIDWKSICFGASKIESNERKLSFIPPSLDGIEKFASLSPSDIAIADQQWKGSLIGYVLGKKPYYLHLRSNLSRQWKLKGNLDIFSRENGCFVLKFSNDQDRITALEDGPWFYDGRLIVLKNWDQSKGLDRDILRSIPVWIRMPELPLRAWTPGSIAAIASVIGTPLLMDTHTATLSRIDYARCLVELKASDVIKKSVNVRMEGDSFTQIIQFEWLPPCCSKYQIFGHSDIGCPQNKVQISHQNTSFDPNSVHISDVVVAMVSKEGSSETAESAQLKGISGNITAVIADKESLEKITPMIDTSEVIAPSIAVNSILSKVLPEQEGSKRLNTELYSAMRDSVVVEPDLVIEDGEITPSILELEEDITMERLKSINSSDPLFKGKDIMHDTVISNHETVIEKVDPIKVDTMLYPEQPFAVTAGGKIRFSHERVKTSLQGTESSSNDDGDVSSMVFSGTSKRRNFAVFLSKTREERFQELRSFGNQIGQKLAKSAISQVSIRDLPQDQEQKEDDGAPFIEVKRKKSKQTRAKGAGEQIRASPRIVKPNPKYIQ